jgi:hypothetical protein
MPQNTSQRNDPNRPQRKPKGNEPTDRAGVQAVKTTGPADWPWPLLVAVSSRFQPRQK